MEDKDRDRSNDVRACDHGDRLSVWDLKMVARRILRWVNAIFGDLSDVLSIPVKLALYGFHIGAGLFYAVCATMNTLGPLTPLILFVWFSPEIALVVREIWRQINSLPPTEAFEISQERWEKALDEIVRTTKKH